MPDMTLLIVMIAAFAAYGAWIVVVMARDAERKHSPLGDLPAALLTIVLIVMFYCVTVRVRRLNAGLDRVANPDAEQPAENERR